MLLGVQTFHVLKTVQKCKKSLKIPHPQISLKQFSNICKNVVYFFTTEGGGKMIKDFRKTKKKLKN